jgi:ArsR family transcriptional regulator
MKRTDPDVALLAALADPVRLSFVRQLADNEGICACDFSECCTVSQPTISHHLKVLYEVGLLDRSKRGVWVYYRAKPEALADLAALLGGVGR